jgi:hypothetical protein
LFYLDGIVAINKPYGICVYLDKKNSKNIDFTNNCHKIVKMANYNIEQILPYLAKELDVSRLIPCTGSEKSVQVPIPVTLLQKCYSFLPSYLFFFLIDL